MSMVTSPRTIGFDPSPSNEDMASEMDGHDVPI
jgi:hypothetical protein